VGCVFVHTVNVKKWEDTVAEDERELEKLKKDENKQMKVSYGRILEYTHLLKLNTNHF